MALTSRVILAGKPTGGWIAVAADDYAEVHVNGKLVGSVGGFHSLTTLDLTPLLKQGSNTIAVLARNGVACAGCHFWENPAGLVFGGTITVE